MVPFHKAGLHKAFRQFGGHLMQTSVGDIYGRTFEIIRERFGSLLGLWATFFAINMALIVVFAMVVGVSAFAGANMAADAGAMGAGMILGVIVFYVLYILVYCAQSASMTAMASPLQRLTFGEALNAGVRSALPMLGLIVILLIAYLAAAMVIGLIIGILAMAGKAVSFIAMLLVFLGAVYLGCRLCTVNAVIAVERVGNPLTALSRGWSMTRDHVLTIFLALLGFGIIAIILVLLLATPFFSMMSAASALAVDPMGTPPEAPGMGSMVFLVIGAIIVGIGLSIVGSTLMSVIHGELAGPGVHNVEEVFS